MEKAREQEVNARHHRDLRRPVTVLAGAAVVAVGIVLLWFVGRILLVIFAGILVAILLRTLSEWISGHVRLRYGLSLTLVLVLLVLSFAASVWFIGRQLVEQLGEFIRELPQTLQPIREFLGQFALGKWILEALRRPDELVDGPEAFMRITDFLTATATGIVAIVIILFVGIYGAAEPRTYIDGLLRLVPPHRRERAGQVLAATGYTLRWWLLGQLMSMIVVGVLTGTGLWLLGVPFALVLGLLAGVLELIPTFGPMIAAVPALLIALSQGPMDLLWVGLLYLGIQSFEGYVLVPLINRQTVWLPPALTIPVVVLLGLMTGALGLFVAAPLTAAGMVLVKTIYVKDVLGDESIETPGEPDG